MNFIRRPLSSRPFPALSTALLVIAATVCGGAQAAAGYVSGTMTDITALAAGLMIRVDAGVPGNCANTPSGWMLIRQTHSAMSALALATWLSGGSKAVDIYGGMDNGWCIVEQFDPR